MFHGLKEREQTKSRDRQLIRIQKEERWKEKKREILKKVRKEKRKRKSGREKHRDRGIEYERQKIKLRV